MKTLYFSVLLLSFFVVSCHHKGGEMEVRANKMKRDTAYIQGSSSKNPLLVLNEDSVKNAEIKTLLDSALKHDNNDVFLDSIEISKYVPGIIRTKIESGCLFSKNTTHTLIKQEVYGDVCFIVYRREKQNHKKIFADTVQELEFTKYTIKDVNNDGFNDLLIHTYGSSGCCLKAFCEVYLYKPDDSGFSEPFRLENPTFSPSEKTVRGVYYGYAGLTPIYKYRFTGLMLDTIESVSRDTVSKEYIIQRYPKNKNKPLLLKDVPVEYRNIFGFDWFMGNI